MVKIIPFITVLFIILFSCKSQKLTIERGNYYGQSIPLRLDGFYYSKVGISYDGRETAKIYFFYRDGVIFGGSGVYLDELIINTQTTLSNYEQREKKTVLGWGIYNIKHDDILEFENWSPSPGGRAKTIVYAAKILSDTSFVVTEAYNHYVKKTYTERDTFHFMPYSPKPDSTNRFIKE